MFFMAQIRESQLQKEENIRKRFKSLAAQKKYSLDYMLEMIASEFYLSTRTIQAIIYGEYEKRREKKGIRQILTN